MNVDRNLFERKNEVLSYMRDRAEESYGEIIRTFGESEYKKRASGINKKIIATTQGVKSIIFQRASSQNWEKEEVLKNILIVTYSSYVIMIEFRNRAWPYEYMAFSRRIGELWEPFCKLCFDYPIREDVELYEAPLFSEVKEKLQEEIRVYINSLNINDDEKNNLLEYYDKVWSLVTSGEIKLELDLHFKVGSKKYNIDFKSGFQSNEKGNTNRLLLVASIYKNIIGGDNECMLFVRADEDENNHYLQTLKKSDIWSVFCGEETYQQISEYSGFDLAKWIQENIDWSNDLADETIQHLRDNDLEKYLTW
jgi:hypothetical protein